MGSKTGPMDESFEALYRQLEETVSRLEQGGLTLQESLALYEGGMKLARRCQEMLEEAEVRIARLQEQFSEGVGSLREEPAEYEAEPAEAWPEEETPAE